MKGQQSGLTTIMVEAEELAMGALADMLEDFGLPLYVSDPGRGKFVWPEDPSQVGPEQMQSLENVWGQPTVERWLMESAMRSAAEVAENEES